MLFSSIDEVKEHLVVGAGTDFNRLKPHIQNAETAYLRPLLGQVLFADLQNFYDNPSTEQGTTAAEPVEVLPELLKLVQKSLIHLTYWSGFQVLNATISDGGFKRTENDKLKSLFKYQEDELKEYFKTAGFNAMDEVLEYLENNSTGFCDFRNSEAWTVFKSYFIPDTKTFNSIIDIKSSRLTFLRLKSYSDLVEDLEIRPLLGVPIFDFIKSEMIKEEPATKVVAILPYIRKATAYLSTALLMEETGADLTEKGLYFETTAAGTHTDRTKQPADPDRVALLAKRNKTLGQNYLEQLKSFLLANAADWPGYSGQKGNVLRRNNTDKKSFWV